MAKERGRSGNGRRLATPQSVDAVVKGICDIMRRSNCAGALQYVPELTWILFLRILDEREVREAERARAVGVEFTPSLGPPHRWQDWAAPGGPKRQELQDGTLGAVLHFVNLDLLPRLRERPGATPRQKVISEIMSGVERTRIDTDRNFLDVLDRVHEISAEAVDPTHVFTLSQVYEGLLLKMGEKGNDLFFTRGQPTERIWYYDLSGVKVGKKSPLTAAHFEEFFRLLPVRGDGERSWTVERKEIDARGYDIKAVNPNARRDEDRRTPEELLDLIEAKGREVAEALAALRALSAKGTGASGSP